MFNSYLPSDNPCYIKPCLMELFKMASELSNVAWISASGKVQIFFNQSLEQKKMAESAPLGYDFNS